MKLINKRDELAESGQYSEGESCSFYMDEISAFKDGWDACSVEYEKYIADLKTEITSLNNKIMPTPLTKEELADVIANDEDLQNE